MVYSVKEIFITLQGEGGQAGHVDVFCRVTGGSL
ncbi:MAG: 7-carboxy-7-deazaguanine synthase, partial [Acetobacter syzygii]